MRGWLLGGALGFRPSACRKIYAGDTEQQADKQADDENGSGAGRYDAEQQAQVRWLDNAMMSRMATYSYLQLSRCMN
jgi:hypothetical protein